jgi:Tfp pilus assembly protein PilN
MDLANFPWDSIGKWLSYTASFFAIATGLYVSVKWMFDKLNKNNEALTKKVNEIQTDINSHIDRLEKKIDVLDERIFWVITGKDLKQAILDERMKQEKNQPKTDP